MKNIDYMKKLKIWFFFQCEISLQTPVDKSVQRDNGGDDNYYKYKNNLSSLSVADVHVTTQVPLQQPQHVVTSSSGSGGGGGDEAEFDVIINQSHYELQRPPLTSRDVIVYVIQLVCIDCTHS